MKLPLYFDNHATTPVDPRVTEAMLPYLQERFGNAESVQHPYGWQAKSGVEKARAQVAALICANANEIVFTSGATESIHLAILGYLETHFDTHGFSNPAHIVTSNAEHKATLEVCARASRYGHAVTILPVDAYGQVSAEQVIGALRSNTALVSLMHANNEIGTINPIASIGSKLRARGILFHVDAAQTAGREAIDVNGYCIDMLSISAHKLYGPKGVGAFYLRKGVHLSPYVVGGGQERGLRGGTPNVPGIIGLGRACEIAKAEMATDGPRLRALRDRVIERVQNKLEGITLNGHPTERLCNNISLTINGVQPDQLLLGLHDIAYSSASACSAGGTSHVLNAIGRETTDAFVTTARFGLGRFNSEPQVETLIERLIEVIQNAREVSKVYDLSGFGSPVLGNTLKYKKLQLFQEDESMISISESAARQIGRLKSETPNSAPESFLRVKVVPGGCSGMSYKLDFDQAVGTSDKVFEEHGTKVVVDGKSLLYIAGMTLDYEGGLNGKGFTFSNPNASKTCGCGSSFGV